MPPRITAFVLTVAVTLSVAWTPNFISVFPFMLPVAVLIIGVSAKFDAIVAAFLALGGMAAVSAAATGASLGYALMWIALAGLYLVARFRLPRVLRRPSLLPNMLAVAVVAVCALALYQVATATTFGTPYALRADQMKLGLATRGESLVQRPVGVFHNSNILGQWLIMALLLLAAAKGVMATKLRWMAFAASGAVLAATYSRAVWVIAVAVVALLVARWVSRSLARIATACIAVSLMGLAALFGLTPKIRLPALPDRFAVGDTLADVGQRSQLNEDGLTTADDHPFVGVGYLQYSVGGEDGLRPHNVFVQAAAEQGYFTAILLAVSLCAVTATCWRCALRSKQDLWLSAALFAMPLTWLGFLVVYSSAADYAVMPIFTLTLGYLLSRVDEAPQPHRARSRPVQRHHSRVSLAR